jgi:hypothetical protein
MNGFLDENKANELIRLFNQKNEALLEKWLICWWN